MNIIHLLSQNHLTGAEVYATSLIEKQLTDGHKVYQISNGFYTHTEAVPFQLEVETKSKLQFIKNVFWLRNFLKKENIQIIHTHSRAAAKLAFYSTLFNSTAQVSTVHGRQHPSFSKKLFNQYGQFIISVCENVKKQLSSDFNYNIRYMNIIPNPIIIDNFFNSNENKNKDKSFHAEVFKIAIVGRATGPKGTRTRLAIESLVRNQQHLPNIELILVGAGINEIFSNDKTAVDHLKNSISQSKIEIKQIEIKNLTGEHYRQWDAVIGSGRVAIEAGISGVPTIAFGEAKYAGLLKLFNLAQFFESNFGDIDPIESQPILDELSFIQDVKEAFKAINNPDSLNLLAKKMCEMFSADIVHKQIIRLYESAYFLKNCNTWIPVLMYHKIPDAEINSQHKIYVTKENFEKHLRFFKSRGFKTLTFSELALFRKGLVSFRHFPKKPLILTFDDGYRDNLQNASPLLQKYGFKAQIFLLADTTLKSNTWDSGEDEPTHEIVSGKDRLDWKNSSFEIGSHGFRHRPITEFTSQAEALLELKESKLSLEAEFGYPIISFAYTYGITCKDSDRLAFDAGYDYAVNTDSGALNLEENPYSIFRVNIFPDENRLSLFKKTSCWYRRYYFFKRGK